MPKHPVQYMFEEKATQLGTSVLISALLVTMVLPAALAPQPFASCEAGDSTDPLGDCTYDVLYNVYTAFLLASLSAFFLSILVMMAAMRAITRPYTNMDTLVVWMKKGRYCQGVADQGTVLGSISLLIAIVVALFAHFTHLSWLPYFASCMIVAIVSLWLHLTASTGRLCNEMQDSRARAFTAAFCDAEGSLTETYRALAWEATEK